VKPRCSELLHNVEIILFATKYLTTELAHSKLNMVYLAELLVVMTDGLKIVRIRARNVPRVHGHKCLNDDAFLSSFSRCRKAMVSRADGPRCHPVET